MFRTLGKYDLPALEADVQQRWDEQQIPARVIAGRADGEPWTFYEGPPTANGRPGVHHVWARVFKDIYPRFQTMRGRAVPRKGGWDCHGLPVELEVEKALGFTGKHDIEAYGIGEFTAKCRESVTRYVGDWTELTRRSGVWIDTDDAYWTMDNSYVESGWSAFKKLWENDLVYEGHRVSPYCTRCGTTLSSHELAQPGAYQDIDSLSVYVRFPLVDRHADLLVWTTTPWTLLANSAAAINPALEYVEVMVPGNDRPLIMAKPAFDRLAVVDEASDAEGGEESDAESVAWAITGAVNVNDLLGARYQPPFEVPVPPARAEAAFKVLGDEFVTDDSGSGVVHLAPAFGEVDSQIGEANGLPVLSLVGPDGRYVDGLGDWSGQAVGEVGPPVVGSLTGRDLLVAQELYNHSYPHCWRCDTPLIYRAQQSWFVRTESNRATLLKANEQVDWHPGHIKEGRFGKWLETNIDWALSRDRYWGTPLPVWRCESGHDTVAGSLADLEQLSGQTLTDLDLHRPAVDEITVNCQTCEAPATRLNPVLDAWYDSGAMPFAQHGFQFGRDGDLPSPFPAQFICEAIDQTRGWFYSLIALNSLLYNQTPFESCIVLGHIVDGDGQKMSKSRGNVVDPYEVFDNIGADALRWFFFAAGQPWAPRKLSVDRVKTTSHKFMETLWNVAHFFMLYAVNEEWKPSGEPLKPTGLTDAWILSELDLTVRSVTDNLEAFDAYAAATSLNGFVDNLSNWYVRRSRSRFWSGADDDAYGTLHECLVTVCKLLAPFIPFYADGLWASLNADGSSVHEADWPTEQGWVDADLSREMAVVRNLVGLGRNARQDANLKGRQPLASAKVAYPGAPLRASLMEELADELNVKAVERLEQLDDVVTWSVTPDFRALGPRLGADMPKVGGALKSMASPDVLVLKGQAEAAGADGQVEVAGIPIDTEHLVFNALIEDDAPASVEDNHLVMLDPELTDELVAEGIVRELSRRVNEARRDLGFEIFDRINLTVNAEGLPPETEAAIAANTEWLQGETLALSITVAQIEGETGVATVDLNGGKVALQLLLANSPTR